MKFGRSPPSGATGNQRGFYELAQAHVAAHGGEWRVIDKRENLQQWRAWIAYFAWLDDQTVPKGRKAVTFRMLDKLTAPTAWPLEFDASAPPAPLPEPREEMPPPRRRKQLADMLRRAVADIQLQEQRAPSWRNMTPAQAQDRLETLAAEYAAKSKVAVTTPEMARYLDDMQALEGAHAGAEGSEL
jgi:hypothetical protein